MFKSFWYYDHHGVYLDLLNSIASVFTIESEVVDRLIHTLSKQHTFTGALRIEPKILPDYSLFCPLM